VKRSKRVKRITAAVTLAFAVFLSGCYLDGDNGAQGSQGIQGIQGEKGDPGLVGDPGEDGSSVLAGKGSPTDNIVAFPGDVYLDVDTGQIWGPYTAETKWGTEPSGVLKCKCKKFCRDGNDRNED